LDNVSLIQAFGLSCSQKDQSMFWDNIKGRGYSFYVDVIITGDDV